MPVTSSSLPPASATGAATRTTNSSASNKTRDVNVGDADENDPQVIKQLLITVLKDRTADGGAVAKTVTPSAGDTCTWYANKQCTVARTCYDCLNTKLAGQNPQSCMVDNFGACVSMALYKPEKDFRRARPPNAVGSTISNQYPGVNATYCSNDDKYCALCRNTWTNPFDNSQLSYLPFCRGTGGCVCIQTCESPFHNDNVILQRCIDLSSVPSVSVYTSIGFMVALCGVIGVVTFCVRRWMNRSRALARPAAFRHDLRLPQREPSGPRLGLSGWRSMREKLIESEREQLQLNGDNHLRAVPVVDLPSSIEPVETDQGLIPLSPTPPPPSQHSAEETDVELHESDMSNPSAEIDLVASPAPVVVSTRTEL